MKSSEFKKILKPLIEQTVREVLLQEGVLSRVVSEVAKGLNPVLVSESKKSDLSAYDKQELEESYMRQKQERIKKLNESTSFKNPVFENVSPIPDSGGRGQLSGVSSSDSGVDISAIQSLANGKWKKLAGNE